MQNIQLNTVEYYDGVEQDRLIGAVYVPETSAAACATRIGKAILKALGGNCLTAKLMDGQGNDVDELTVFRDR